MGSILYWNLPETSCLIYFPASLAKIYENGRGYARKGQIWHFKDMTPSISNILELVKVCLHVLGFYNILKYLIKTGGGMLVKRSNFETFCQSRGQNSKVNYRSGQFSNS